MKKTILNITREDNGNITANFNEKEIGNFVATIKQIFDDQNKQNFNNCKCGGNCSNQSPINTPINS